MLGWEYSAFVFLGVNFFAMVLIMGLYLSMFTIIREDRQRARPVTMKKQEDVVLALRFFFIVLTDCLCWIPIVIIKILALCEVRISENVYAWVVVFILPINSALNPVIYTLAAPTELRRRIERFSQRILKCHKQIECMLTSNRTPRSSVATQSLTGTDIASASTDCTFCRWLVPPHGSPINRRHPRAFRVFRSRRHSSLKRFDCAGETARLSTDVMTHMFSLSSPRLCTIREMTVNDVLHPASGDSYGRVHKGSGLSHL
ncbi:hypothetical protein MTO96_012903 [Rhipicephalus appendiculatus]